MGALYEDVEKFFGDIFAFYGKFLARYPVVFILISLMTSSLLGMGLLNIKYESHVDKLYTPMGSPALKDQARLIELFPERTSKAFYSYQQLLLDTYGSILIQPIEEEEEEDGEDKTQDDDKPPTAADSTRGEKVTLKPKQNILSKHVLNDVHRLYQDIMAITLEKDDQGFGYEDLCAARHKQCVVDGEVLLNVLLEDMCLNPNDSYPYLTQTDGRIEDLRTVLSTPGVSLDGCLTAKAFRVRFNLRHDTPHQRDLSLLWAKKFLQTVSQFKSEHASISYSASESLDIELTEHIGNDTKFFALTIVIMIVYATFVSSGGNWVSTRVLLAQAGVLAALLAILASFGLLSMCGMTFVDICGVMPFLVLGVGVDDMFILMSGWRQTDVNKGVEERISETFRSSAISVTITSLTDLLAFCIGATSPFVSVKNFCIYTGVAVFLCYINQLTFFGGCLVLHARRVASSRHCLTCLRTSSRRDLTADGHSRLHVLCCAGHPSDKAGEDDSLCEKIPSSFLPRMLLKGPTKALIIIGFIIYISVSVWGASQIKTGLKLESVVPESSYLHEFITREREHFPNRGAHIMFVIDEPVVYTDSDVLVEINNVFSKAMASGFLDPNFRVSWLERYMDYRKNMSFSNIQHDFLVALKRDFLVQYDQYENDVQFSSDGTQIIASRMYVKSMIFQDSTMEGDLMIHMREIAKNSTLPMVAYGPEFIYYEHYVSILKNTLLAVGVAILGMLFVALMFIPHPISITCVTLTMVTIVLGMFGFMHFWDLALSAITTVQIILSVGFCVDFTVHISHAFMTATGKNRNERVMSALEKVGVPILNGAVSSILGILMLAFTSSYVFKSFFKTMLLVILLGVAHSLLFLPVMLSFVGPRRTSKPRVFVQIAAPSTTSARVLNDMMDDYRPPPSGGPHVHPQHPHRGQPPQLHQNHNHNPTRCNTAAGFAATVSPPSGDNLHEPTTPGGGAEHIELLYLSDNTNMPPRRDTSAPAMLSLADIELDERDERGTHSDDGNASFYGIRTNSNSHAAPPSVRNATSTGNVDLPQTTTTMRQLPHAQRVVIETPPEEQIRLSHFVSRADRTPSPLLSKPIVEKRERSGSRELLDRLGNCVRNTSPKDDDYRRREGRGRDRSRSPATDDKTKKL